jgi:uncharacterized protein YndB with AHSA1/START domain
MNATRKRYQVSIEADPSVPISRLTRDFDATPAQLMRAHTDPNLFARWVGPGGMETKILEWDATTGGRWRYVAGRDGEEYGFHGCFHDLGGDRIIHVENAAEAMRLLPQGQLAVLPGTTHMELTRSTPGSRPPG